MDDYRRVVHKDLLICANYTTKAALDIGGLCTH